MQIFTNALNLYNPSQAARNLVKTLKSAEKTKIPVEYIPFLDDSPDHKEDLQSYFNELPASETHSIAFWKDFIPTDIFYTFIYESLSSKRIFLVNTPEQHNDCLYFDRFYSHIAPFTPKSIFITKNEVSVLPELLAANNIEFPVFVKGDIKSCKEHGISKVIANNQEELLKLVNLCFNYPSRTRTHVIIRELVSLQHDTTSALGIPFSREYRIFVLYGEIIGMGYYWEGKDNLDLTDSDRYKIQKLVDVVNKMDIPYVCIDVAQKTDLSWIIIELGDPQFSGTSNIDEISLFTNIKQIITKIEAKTSDN